MATTANVSQNVLLESKYSRFNIITSNPPNIININDKYSENFET